MKQSDFTNTGKRAVITINREEFRAAMQESVKCVQAEIAEMEAELKAGKEISWNEASDRLAEAVMCEPCDRNHLADEICGPRCVNLNKGGSTPS